MKRHKHSGRYLSKTPRGRYAWKRRPMHKHRMSARQVLEQITDPIDRMRFLAQNPSLYASLSAERRREEDRRTEEAKKFLRRQKGRMKGRAIFRWDENMAPIIEMTETEEKYFRGTPMSKGLKREGYYYNPFTEMVALKTYDKGIGETQTTLPAKIRLDRWKGVPSSEQEKIKARAKLIGLMSPGIEIEYDRKHQPEFTEGGEVIKGGRIINRGRMGEMVDVGEAYLEREIDSEKAKKIAREQLEKEGQI